MYEELLWQKNQLSEEDPIWKKKNNQLICASTGRE